MEFILHEEFYQVFLLVDWGGGLEIKYLKKPFHSKLAIFRTFFFDA